MDSSGTNNGNVSDNLPQSIAVSAPAGFMTGGALQVGFWKAMAETGLLSKVKFISSTSVGAFNGIMALTGRIEDLEKLWLSLVPQDVFRRKDLLSLGFSHLLVWLAGLLSALQHKNPPFIMAFRPPYFTSRLFLLAILVGFAITLPDPFAAVSFSVSVGVILLHRQILRWTYGLLMNLLWLAVKIKGVNWFVPKLQEFIHQSTFHSDAWNEQAIEEKTRNALNINALKEAVLAGSVRLAISIVNVTKWRLEVYALGGGEPPQRIDVSPPQEIDENLIEDIVFAASSVPTFFPLRKIGEDWYCDGALLKPNPMSYCFDADCDLIIVFVNDEPIDTSRPITIPDTAKRVIDIDQRERFYRELQIADEKSNDIYGLKSFIKDIKLIVGHAVSNKAEAADVKKQIDERAARSGFSFRWDKDVRRIIVAPKWTPAIDVKIYGGYGDFSLIPQLIQRGYEETMRVLRREKLIAPNGNGQS